MVILAITTYKVLSQYICQKKAEQHYIAVGTVKIFIETSAKHLQSPVYNKIARIKCYTTIF